MSMRNQTILRKFVSIVVTLTLVLMMVPHYLFQQRAQAHAETKAALNLADNHFGEFSYNQNANGNLVKYSTKQIFEKITQKEETQDSVQNIAEAAISKALVEAQVEYAGTLSAPIATPSYTATTIKEMTSDLNCLKASKIDAKTWLFDVSDPGKASANGKLSLVPEFATFSASYEIEAATATTYTFDYSSAKGTITVAPTGIATSTTAQAVTADDKTNNTKAATAKAKSMANVTAQVEVKTVTPDANGVVEYGVSVTKNGGNNGDASNQVNNPTKDVNEGYFKDLTTSATQVAEYGDSQEFTAEDVLSDDAPESLQIKEISIPESKQQSCDFTIGGDKRSFTIQFFHQFKTTDILPISYKYIDSDHADEQEGSCTLGFGGNIGPKQIDVLDVKSTISDESGAMYARTYAMQKVVMADKLLNWAEAQKALPDTKWKTIDGKEICIFIDEPNLFSDSDYQLWDGKQTLNINTNSIKLCDDKGNLLPDYTLQFNDASVKVNAPKDKDYSEVVFYQMEDGQEVTVEHPDPESDCFVGYNNGNKNIMVGSKDSSHTVANKEGKTFTNKVYPTLEQSASTVNEIFKSNVLVLNKDNNTLTRVSKDIRWMAENPFVGYTVTANGSEHTDWEQGETDESLFGKVIKFIFGAKEVNVKCQFKNFGGTDLNSAKIVGTDKTELVSSDKLIDGDFVYITFTFDSAKYKNYESDLPNWKIYPSYGNKGEYFNRLESALNPPIDGSPTRIVANADAPNRVEYIWGEADSTTTEPPELSDQGQTLRVRVYMEDDALQLFKYTIGFKPNEVFANVNSIKGVNYGSLTYGQFTNPENTDYWEAVLPIDLPTDMTRPEDKITAVINPVQDILGRYTKADKQEAGGGTPKAKIFTFGIDKCDPYVDLQFEGASQTNKYGDKTYFSGPREAVITVDELNFNGEYFEINKKDVGYNVDPDSPVSEQTLKIPTKDWTRLNSYNIDDCDKWEYRIKYPEQGDYRLDVVGHDNLKLEDGSFPHQSNHSDSGWFCLDWTNPTLSVAWDNNNVVNDKYYTAARTATLVLNERNFASEYFPVNPIITAGHDGTMGSANFSGWTRSGVHTYTATVSFPTEGTYAMTVDGKDLALNALTPYSQPEFIIDWTAPNIQISNVQDHQAYADEIAPVVTINDANMSPETTCQVNNLGITKANPFQTSPATSDAQYTYSYSSPERIPDNDGVFRVNVNAVDMAGNSSQQTLVWSVNRFGSTYVIDPETEKMMDGYVNNKTKQDVKVTEINPSGLESSHVDETKGGFTSTLEEGKDYSATSSGGGDSWFERNYNISKDHFTEDNRYSLFFISKDTAGHDNENTMDNKNQERDAKVNVRFMLDNAAPSVYYNDLSEAIYGEASHDASVVFEDNSNEFTNAQVTIDGEDQYIDGKDLKNGNYKVDMKLQDSATPHNITVAATDKAGNVMEKSSKTVVVSTNPLVQWFYNTPLFVGSLIGIAVIAAGIVAYVLYRKKQEDASK